MGIGANTAIFSLIDAVLFKMLPVQNPEQLVVLNWASHGRPVGVLNSISGNMYEYCDVTCPSFSYPSFEQIRAGNRVFSSVAAMATSKSELNVGYKGVPGRADGQLASGTFFRTLGIQPILGRAFTPEDDRTGASPVAVIGCGYWERRFGRDPRVVGQTITVNSVPFTIVVLVHLNFTASSREGRSKSGFPFTPGRKWSRGGGETSRHARFGG